MIQASVDLQLKDPLPLDWEQCLDLESGRMYYLNRKTLRKTRDWPKDQKLDLELNISSSFKHQETMNDQNHYYYSKKQNYSSSNYKGNNSGSSSMIALPCSNCHLLVIVSESSPCCPNCKCLRILLVMVLSKLYQLQTVQIQPQSISPPPILPNSNQSTEPPVPQSAEVPNTTYAAHNYAHQELSASNHDIDILADILPPSAPSPSLHPSSDDAIPSAPLAEQTGFPSYSGLTAQPTGYAATHGQDASLTGFAAQPGLQSPQTSYPIHGQPLSQIGFSGQTSNSSFFGGYSVQPGQTPQTSFGLQSSQPASLNGFPSASGSFPHPGIQVTAGQSLQTNANFGGYNTGLGSIGSVSTQMGQTPAGPSFLTQPATASHIPSQMSLPYSQNQTSNRSMPAQSAPVSTALISSNQPANDKFETKSTVWADTLSRGLVNLNISGSKTYPLADIGVHFDAINRKEKRMEKPSTAPVTSTVTMGKAMGSGSGSGIGRAGALRPSSNPMAGAGRGMAMGAGAPGASAMGVYGVNQPLGMGMARPVHMGMGMNMGQGVHMQQPTGFPPGSTMPGGYNPMMGADSVVDRKLNLTGRYCSSGFRKRLSSSEMAYELDEQKKVGLGLIGFGILFTFLAIILFFDRGLLALANILMLAGVALLLGWRSTLQLFKVNYKGTISFLLGLFLIFVRWPVVGIIVEIYGCIVLFSCFWPSIKVFLFQIPVFGWILQYPALLLDRFRS
ncbi:hypothetical protein K7X08_023472 [Anisodus acutangulus]|uniref:WW domain-containing protein n=1 Tax=Anisodus acutangulus TaxID=402998 RepID=A0A9Q1QX12_9SOLA|nr:hypothetical protein K7X08_023472 [Anisodus acutangulus]